MKTVVTRASLLARLGVSAAALLFAQQAVATGTDAGVTVSNQATIAYTVNTVVQTPIESSPTGNSTPGGGSSTDFVVDRRVDFVFTAADSAPTEIRPTDVRAIAAFSLTNESNAVMDFELTLDDLASGVDVNGFTDTGDLMANYEIRVANGDGAASAAPPPGSRRPAR